MLKEVLRLLHGADVRAYCDLYHAGEAEYAHRLLKLARRAVGAELADDGRRDDGNYLVALLDSLYKLEDLALIRYGAEGAVDKTLSAGGALVVVDHRASALVRADGIHAAGLRAGALNMADGLIRTLRLAAAALDALFLVNAASAVFVNIYGVLRADRLAGS